jgi:hypothetical protein
MKMCGLVLRGSPQWLYEVPWGTRWSDLPPNPEQWSAAAPDKLLCLGLVAYVKWMLVMPVFLSASLARAPEPPLAENGAGTEAKNQHELLYRQCLMQPLEPVASLIEWKRSGNALALSQWLSCLVEWRTQITAMRGPRQVAFLRTTFSSFSSSFSSFSSSSFVLSLTAVTEPAVSAADTAELMHTRLGWKVADLAAMFGEHPLDEMRRWDFWGGEPEISLFANTFGCCVPIVFLAATVAAIGSSQQGQHQQQQQQERAVAQARLIQPAGQQDATIAGTGRQDLDVSLLFSGAHYDLLVVLPLLHSNNAPSPRPL